RFHSPEIGRVHPDDRHRNLVQGDLLADYGSVTRKAATPIAVTENRDHPRRAPGVIGSSDWPTGDCRNANALVEAPRNQFATYKFRLPVNNCGNTPNGLERE